MTAPVKNSEPTNDAESKKVKQKRNRKLILFTIFLIVLGLAWLAYWLLYLQFHESTDDAYGNGNMISVNSVINAPVTAFYADNTDFVKEGQLLVQLDDTYYKVQYEKDLATLGAVVLQVQQLYDNVKASRANYENKKTALARAQFDYDNRSKLIESKAISNEDFVHAQEALDIAKHNVNESEFQLDVALGAAGNTAVEKHPLIEQQKAIVRTAYYNLKHTAIYASQSGYIAQRSVDVGQWVTPTKSLMSIIPTDYVWVDANFKETQLTKMRVGQPATVWLDIYGSDVVYQGKVLGIASGTGSVFSVIPPQNATGNWIKIVQRLPVRISLDPEVAKKYPVRIGLSAEVNVDVSDTSLPMLTTVVPSKPVNSTDVLQLNFEELNQRMDAIVKENLQKK